MSALLPQAETLIQRLREYGSCVVCYSGGVDSAVVAQAAHLALGDRAIALTGVSASLASGELEQAMSLAQQIGIRHEIVQTQELENPAYQQNRGDRCYFCKHQLYDQAQRVAQRLGFVVVANGANLDDLGDYRPGMEAAREQAVRSPLVEAGLNKEAVRTLAKAWNLPVWDKPATPCLASRIAVGQVVTAERLRQIDEAEVCLRSHGLTTVRVRFHEGDLARIETAPDEWPRLLEVVVREEVVARLQALGFRYITLDLQGYRSGSLNPVVPVTLLSVTPSSGK